MGSAGGVSLYTLWQLVILHEHNGKRFSRYHELAQVCLQASGALANSPWSQHFSIVLTCTGAACHGRSSLHDTCSRRHKRRCHVVSAGSKFSMSCSAAFYTRTSPFTHWAVLLEMSCCFCSCWVSGLSPQGIHHPRQIYFCSLNGV